MYQREDLPNLSNFQTSKKLPCIEILQNQPLWIPKKLLLEIYSISNKVRKSQPIASSLRPPMSLLMKVLLLENLMKDKKLFWPETITKMEPLLLWWPNLSAHLDSVKLLLWLSDQDPLLVQLLKKLKKSKDKLDFKKSSPLSLTRLVLLDTLLPSLLSLLKSSDLL